MMAMTTGLARALVLVGIQAQALAENGAPLALKRRMINPEGDPPPRRLSLAVAHAKSRAPSTVAFDLKVAWPRQDLASVPGVEEVRKSCRHEVLANDGTSTAATVESISPRPDGYIARAVHTSQSAPVPDTLRLRVSCPGLSSDDAGVEFNLVGSRPNASAVVIDLGRAPKQARLDELTRQLPAHNDWPRLVESDWIQGLRPGSQVVVVAVADSKKVADALARALRAGGVSDVAVRPVWVPAPEKLHIVVADNVHEGPVGGGGITGYASSDGDADAFILQEGVSDHRACEPCSPEVRARGAVLDGDRVALPFTVREGASPAFSITFSAPQTDCRTVRLKARPAQQPALMLHDLQIECTQGD